MLRISIPRQNRTSAARAAWPRRSSVPNAGPKPDLVETPTSSRFTRGLMPPTSGPNTRIDRATAPGTARAKPTPPSARIVGRKREFPSCLAATARSIAARVTTSATESKGRRSPRDVGWDQLCEACSERACPVRMRRKGSHRRPSGRNRWRTRCGHRPPEGRRPMAGPSLR